jgi:hypothetical protein
LEQYFIGDWTEQPESRAQNRIYSRRRATPLEALSADGSALEVEGPDDFGGPIGGNWTFTIDEEAVKNPQRRIVRVNTPDLSLISKDDWLARGVDFDAEGTFFLLSAYGTGKSKLLARVTALLCTIAVTHRVALAQDLAKNMNLSFYADDDAMKSDRLSTPMNSILRATGIFEGCVWDESEQLFSHLVGGTIGKRGGEFINRLTKLCVETKQAFYADGDLSPFTVKNARALCGTERDEILIINEYKPEPHPVLLHEDYEVLVIRLLADMKAGLRPYVACNTRAMASKVYERIMAEFPSASIGLYTQDTTRYDDVRLDLADMSAAALRRDGMVTSPSVGSGVSMVGAGFDRVYGFFSSAGDPLATNAMQQLHRVRDPKDSTLYVWVDPTQRPGKAVSLEVLDARLKRKAKWTERFARLSHRVDPRTKLEEPVDALHYDICLDVAVREANDQADFLGAFLECCADRGYPVTSYMPGATSLDDDGAIVQEKQELQAAKQAVDDRAVYELMNAAVIAKEQADKIDKQHSATRSDRHAVKRQRFDQFYGSGASANESLVRRDRKFGARTATAQLALLAHFELSLQTMNLKGPSWKAVSASDAREARTGLTGIYKSRGLKTKQLYEALDKFGITWEVLGRSEETILTASKEAKDWVLENRQKLKDALGAGPSPKFYQRPFSFIAFLCKLAGIDKKTKRITIDGERKLIHYLDPLSNWMAVDRARAQFAEQLQRGEEL